jgi:hypothetical protein
MDPMKTTKVSQHTVFVLSILLLVLVSCRPLASAPSGAPAATSKPTETALLQFYLTADQLPVTVTHGNNQPITLEKGQTVPISVNDKIAVGDGGIGKLLYSDRVVVEIWQGTEIVMGNVTPVAGDRIEVSLIQNFGHTHITIGENARASVVLKTNDSTITSLTDNTEFSVCYAPGKDGLTCHPVLKGSIQVFGKTGKSQVYNAPPAVGAYTFNGQEPQPPICFHEQEYNDWVSRIRAGEKVEALGALVDRWYHEPCPDGTNTQTSTETPMSMDSSTPMSTAAPTEMSMGSTPQAPTYFTENFNSDTDLSMWPSFQWNNLEVGNYHPQAVATTIKDGYLIFDLQKPNLSTYVMYAPSSYGDVKISLTAHNSGENSSSISLICHSNDEGWYEFRIGNGGLYSILGYMVVEKKYYTLFSGGSNAVHTGMGVNKYSATCIGNELSLFINGKAVNTVKDTMHQFKDGKVGIGVSSKDVSPILEEIDSFTIEKP